MAWPKRMACSVDQTALGSKRHGIAGEFGGKRAVGFEFVIRREDAGFHLVAGEAVALFEVARIGEHLVDGADLALSGCGVGVAEEAVRGEGDAVAQAAAENLADGDAPGLAQNVEAGEFERRQNLGPVVVERGRGVGDEEAHLLHARGVVSHQVGLHRAENGLGRFAAATHFA